jgi:hypothetical protein
VTSDEARPEEKSARWIDAVILPVTFPFQLHPVHVEVQLERDRQERRYPGRTCASPDVSTELKLAVLASEFGEVAHEVTDAVKYGRPPSDNLRAELVQLCAVAQAWIEALT